MKKLFVGLVFVFVAGFVFLVIPSETHAKCQEPGRIVTGTFDRSPGWHGWVYSEKSKCGYTYTGTVDARAGTYEIWLPYQVIDISVYISGPLVPGVPATMCSHTTVHPIFETPGAEPATFDFPSLDFC